MIHHTSVSLDYLEACMEMGKQVEVFDSGMGEEQRQILQGETVRQWRSQGYTYAPPCDNIRPNGQCAGHEENDMPDNPEEHYNRRAEEMP